MAFKSKLEVEFHKKWRLPYETAALPYIVTHHYHPDWQVGTNAYIETKGLWLGDDRAKMRYIQKQHPHITVLMAFQDPAKKLSKASKTTYSAWCDKYDIPWCHHLDEKAITNFIAKHK